MNQMENLDEDIVQEALSSSLDLRDYSNQVETQLKQVENDAIQNYIAEADTIGNLHNQICACDEILERMERMLTGFQDDLGSISHEIQSLQEQSIVMNLKLKNRQAVRGELSQFVDEMVVSEAMINHIMDSPVSEREFLEQLHELQHKINFIKELSFKEAKASGDVADVLEKLKLKAIAKIREFLLQKIYQFRKPLTNFQIPQNTMLKHRFYYEFLIANNRQIAVEVRDEYVDTVGKMFYSYFKTYAGRLLKLQYDDVATKDDLLGAVDTIKGSMGLFGVKTAIRNKSTVFTVGDRANVIKADLESDIIVPHMALQSNQKFPFESIFRSLNFALMDNSCREFLFLSDFFMVNGNAAIDLFSFVMGKATHIVLSSLDGYIAQSYDSVSLILCIHIVLRYQKLMRTRNVPALDKYWEAILDSLWPRFLHVVDLNIKSVMDADATKVGEVDTRPHYFVRRYAEFSAALVSINQSGPDGRVVDQLAKLQSAEEEFVLKLAAEFKRSKERLIFLINNYDLMLTVLAERTTENSTEAESYRELLQARTAEYIEEILAPHFGLLVTFVKEFEFLTEQNQTDSLKKYTAKAGPIIKSFNQNWKSSLEQINSEVMRSFTNLMNGTNILQSALTQLLQYYQRFAKILTQPQFASVTEKEELINFHRVMVEVKKFKPIF